MFRLFFSAIFISAFPLVLQAQDATLKNPDTNAGAKLVYTNITEAGFARGILHENRDQAISLSTVNGFMVNNKVSFGLGVSADKYLPKSYESSANSRSLILLPVYTDLRIYFGKGNFQPFFAQGTGYAFCLKQEVNYSFYGFYKEEGGIYLTSAFGARIGLGGKTALVLSLGYRHQQNTMRLTEPNRNYYAYNYTRPEKFTRLDHYLTFKTGITF